MYRQAEDVLARPIGPWRCSAPGPKLAVGPSRLPRDDPKRPGERALRCLRVERAFGPAGPARMVRVEEFDGVILAALLDRRLCRPCRRSSGSTAGRSRRRRRGVDRGAGLDLGQLVTGVPGVGPGPVGSEIAVEVVAEGRAAPRCQLGCRRCRWRCLIRIWGPNTRLTMATSCQPTNITISCRAGSPATAIRPRILPSQPGSSSLSESFLQPRCFRSQPTEAR
jgi:hypothetical protein